VAYGTFATDGTRYAPQVANSIVSPTGKVVKRFKPRVMAHVSLPADTYAQILTGLKGAIYDPNGTAYATFQGYNGIPLAGKTGTARRARSTACSPRPGSSPSADDGHSALRRRRRDRPGGLRSGSSRPVARQNLHLPDRPPGRSPDLHPPANAP